MHKLKKISFDAIPRAISKAERYRLLNEPRAAESICRDVLAAATNHDQALRILLLALTDQFRGVNVRPDEARELVALLGDEYSKHYYEGVILERWAKALLDAGYHGHTVYDKFTEALASYERAVPLADAGNEDAILRWNTCVRIIEANGLCPAESSGQSPPPIESFDNEVPYR